VMPSLNDRKKDFNYEMELFFNEDALKRKIRKIVKNKENIPILFSFKEK